MASDAPEPRRAVAYAARRVTVLGRMPWQGYAFCPACGWTAFYPAARTGVDAAHAAAAEHVCPPPVLSYPRA